MCHFEYTAYTLPDIIKIISDMSDTKFHFSDNIRRIIRRSVFALNFCLIENDKIPPNLNARAGKQNIFSVDSFKKIIYFLGKLVPCNGVNMAKKGVCICDEEHTYDPFIAGMLVQMCPKTDKSIIPYINE